MLHRVSRSFFLGLLLCASAGALAGLSLLAQAQQPDKKPDAVTGPTPIDTRKKYALLVGINDYDHAKLAALKYAENDVAELAVVLRKAGYEVIVLSGAEGKKDRAHEPTKENFDQSLAALLKKFQKGDTILLAFAGHGVQFDKECYFCPRDARPFKDKTESMLALSKVYHELEAAFDGTKILLVDACRNDPDPGRGSRGIDADSAQSPPKGVAALFSCSANERAFESDTLKHGIFFHYVIEALQGKGGANDRGEVTWSRLTEYVPDKVETQVPKLIGRNAKQTPNMKADLAGRSPVLVRLDNPQKPDDTVAKDPPKTVKQEVLEIEVLGDETLKRINGENADLQRCYRIQEGKESRLLTLQELKGLFKENTKEPRLHRVIIRLYNDSPARETLRVRELQEWAEEQTTPDGKKVEVTLSLIKDDAPIK
jgi:hypothetical protein